MSLEFPRKKRKDWRDRVPSAAGEPGDPPVTDSAAAPPPEAAGNAGAGPEPVLAAPGAEDSECPIPPLTRRRNPETGPAEAPGQEEPPAPPDPRPEGTAIDSHAGMAAPEAASTDAETPEPTAASPGPARPDSPASGEAGAEPPQALRARPNLSWLNDDDGDHPEWGETSGEETAPAASAPENGARRPKPRRNWPMAFAAAMLAGLAGYLALTQKQAPKSAALEAERIPIGTAGPVVPDLGAPEPVPAPPGAEPEAPAPDEEEAAAPALPEEGTPAGEPVALELPAAAPVPVEKPPMPASVRPRPEARPPAAVPSAGNEALALIVRKLEAQQALIERLERSEQILRDRIEGLEINAGSGNAPAAPPARVATAPKKPRSKRLPPETTSLPVKTLTQRPSSPPSGGPLPFSVETVDRINGDPIVVVRAGGRLVDLKPGESHAGWRIESAAGQVVTVRSPDGGERTVRAGGGSGP